MLEPSSDPNRFTTAGPPHSPFHPFNLFQACDERVPALPPLRLPDLTVTVPALQSCVSSVKSKAAGADGWGASALMLLPLELEPCVGLFPIGPKQRLLASGLVPLQQSGALLAPKSRKVVRYRSVPFCTELFSLTQETTPEPHPLEPLEFCQSS